MAKGGPEESDQAYRRVRKRSDTTDAVDILHDLLGFAAKDFVVFATIAATAVFMVTVVRRKRPPTAGSEGQDVVVRA